MNVKTLKAAKEEAKKFLVKVRELEEQTGMNPFYIHGSKLSGAVRRASMDLTRALSELRK